MKYIEIKNKKELVNEIHKILDISGKNLFKEYGLDHWIPAYSIQKIISDLETKQVYLVYSIKDESNIGTFMLLKENNNIKIEKFSLHPDYEGKGYATVILKYIEDSSKKKKMDKIVITVYDKNTHAINFYKKNNFIIKGKQKTANYSVYIMEKEL